MNCIVHKEVLTSKRSLLIIKIMKEWTKEEIKAFRESLTLYQKDFALLLGVTSVLSLTVLYI